MELTRREVLKASLLSLVSAAGTASCAGCLTLESAVTEAAFGPTVACDARLASKPGCTHRFCRYYTPR